MSAAAKKLIEAALALPETERRLVAERLLDSVTEESPAALRKAWDAEAMKRAAALEEVDTSIDIEPALRGLEDALRSKRAR